jgi:hypothetical protein
VSLGISLALPHTSHQANLTNSHPAWITQKPAFVNWSTDMTKKKQQRNDKDMTKTWQKMTKTWQRHDIGMTKAWQRPDKEMTKI